MPNQLTFFKKSIISEKKKNETSLFCVYDPLGVKLLTCLRLQFSHLNEHKFRMVLVIQSILYVHEELKFKLLNVSSCVLLRSSCVP